MKKQLKTLKLNKKGSAKKMKNTFEFIKFDETVTSVTKHNTAGYFKIAECGARRLFKFCDYVFMDSSDKNDQTHYFIATSHSDEDYFDTYYELNLESFYEFIGLYLNDNNHDLLLEELESMELAGGYDVNCCPNCGISYNETLESTEYSNLALSTLSVLGDIVIQHAEYGKDEITFEVHDVNAKVHGNDLQLFISNGLKSYGYNPVNIKFSYGNENWMTVALKNSVA
jgi:hypothetical protein